MPKRWLRRALVATAQALLLAACAWGLFLFRHHRPWMSGGWRGIAQAYASFFALIALGTVALRALPPSPRLLATMRRGVLYAAAAGLAALYALNYLSDLEYNPLVVWGEWAIAFKGAEELWERLGRGVYSPPSNYKIGVGYLYLPLYALFGPCIAALKALYLACWTWAVLALARVWKRERGWEGLFSILLVVSTLAYGRAIERTYKWHVMAAYLSAALFCAASSLDRRRAVAGFLLLAGALGFAIVGYHGCAVYLVFLAVYGLCAAACASPARKLRPWVRTVLLLGAAAAVVALVYLWPETLFRHFEWFFRQRVVRELSGIYAYGRFALNFMQIAQSFFVVFFQRMGPLASSALVAGLAAALVDFRRAWDARFITTGFWLLWALTMALYPFNNLDEANYLVIFVYLAMAYGVHAGLVRIGNPALRLCAVVAFGACLAWQEETIYGFYYRNNCVCSHPDNRDTQGVIALYDMRKFEDPEASVVFFPAPGIPGAQGGLGSAVHSVVLPMHEYAAWNGKIRYYESIASLRRLVRGALTARRGSRDRVVAYASPALDRQEMKRDLAGVRYLLSEVAYFQEEWGVRVPVCKFAFLGVEPLAPEDQTPAEAAADDDKGPQFAIVSGKWDPRSEQGEIVHIAHGGDGPGEARWVLDPPAEGNCEVYARWTSAWNRASDAPFTIRHADGNTTVRVDQRQDGGTWVNLGRYRFRRNEPAVVSLGTDADGWVIAGAVRLVACPGDLQSATGELPVATGKTGLAQPHAGGAAAERGVGTGP